MNYWNYDADCMLTLLPVSDLDSIFTDWAILAHDVTRR
jgi:hypothetical protein